ncbi:hypothetical protein MLD38_000110 [Melastoma candidum]|uniref:Uncharacterized protein n=1 Tax=Melastoma candidum TaxID=119954 RepID=A0ACB9SAL2_9MYRT|nr:hypothetical protein MLD38_000110 [Melastoma candidum]
MGRGKLALELIAKEKSRRVTFEKRKKGLMKKAHEFSVLCGVDTCMIIYPDRTSEPEVWPPEPEKVRRIIDRYRSEGPDRRSKRTTGLPDFFINRKKKLDAELKKVRTANWEAKYPVSDEMIVGLSEDQLQSLLVALRGKLDDAKERLAAMKAAKLQQIAESEMMFYDFYPKDNDQFYPDHLALVPSNFMDAKPGFDFSNGCPDPQMLQPMPDPNAVMYNTFSNELPQYGVHGNLPYPPIAHNNDMAIAGTFNGFGDRHYSPMPPNVQFSPLGSVSGMTFPEPTFNFLSNMAFAENMGHCEGMLVQMQMQMPSISNQQMVPRVGFTGVPVEQQTEMEQAMMPRPSHS